jgi:hypothetical protein
MAIRISTGGSVSMLCSRVASKKGTIETLETRQRDAGDVPVKDTGESRDTRDTGGEGGWGLAPRTAGPCTRNTCMWN